MFVECVHVEDVRRKTPDTHTSRLRSTMKIRGCWHFFLLLIQLRHPWTVAKLIKEALLNAHIIPLEACSLS
jgi:hypothetical protein